MSLKEDFIKIHKLQSLQQCQKVQAITKKQTGFGYDKIDDILQDLYNEIDELKAEIKISNKDNLNKQRIFFFFFDVLFVLCNLANKFDIDCNEALLYSTAEFERRIIYCEENCAERDLKKISNQEMIELWKRAKKAKDC